MAQPDFDDIRLIVGMPSGGRQKIYDELICCKTPPEVVRRLLSD
jgi:hypothetical protein